MRTIEPIDDECKRIKNARKYRETRRKCARKYQHKTQRMKAITIRYGKNDGRVLSTRAEVSINTNTNTISVACAIWHARAIYAGVFSDRKTLGV